MYKDQKTIFFASLAICSLIVIVGVVKEGPSSLLSTGGAFFVLSLTLSTIEFLYHFLTPKEEKRIEHFRSKHTAKKVIAQFDDLELFHDRELKTFHFASQEEVYLNLSENAGRKLANFILDSTDADKTGKY